MTDKHSEGWNYWYEVGRKTGREYLHSYKAINTNNTPYVEGFKQGYKEYQLEQLLKKGKTNA